MSPIVNPTTLRLDKWLWVARFFKTRALATSSIKAGHVKILMSSGQSKTVKPALEINIGDWLEIQRGAFQFTIEIKGIHLQRQSAPLAQALYEETQDSIERREEVAVKLRAQPKNPFGGKKPDKHTLRKNRALKRGY